MQFEVKNFVAMDEQTQDSNQISQGRVVDNRVRRIDRRKAGKGKIRDIQTGGVTRTQEGAEQKINLSLAFHMLRKVQ